MSDRRRTRVDWFAFGFLISGILLALCVLTHDPENASPAYPSQPTDHIMGELGAWFAQRLYETFGVAVFVLLGAWYVFVLLLLLKREAVKWLGRLAGWMLLVPCTSLVAHEYSWDFVPATWLGPGGLVGLFLSEWLNAEFVEWGKNALMWSAVALSFCLAFDFVAKRVLQFCCGVIRFFWCVIYGALWGVYKTLRGEIEQQAAIEEPEQCGDEVEDYQAVEADNGIPIRHLEPVQVHSDMEDDAVEEEPARLPINRATEQEEDEPFANYELPSMSLLSEPEPFPYEEHDQQLRKTANLLEKTFQDFSLNVRVVGINTGPVITQYEVSLETGLRVNKVTNLSDDLALNLKVPSVRIVAPIPGKNTVGIEVPNEHRAVVRLKEALNIAGRKTHKCKIPLFLGKDAEGRPMVYDLAEMPHLLIAGRTGTGKSVCLNALIMSILMTRRPDDVRMLLIDPKMTELIEYSKIPHLMHPVVKDMKKAEAILSWAVDKMEERYDLLSRARVRNIASYNALSMDEILQRVRPLDDEEAEKIPERMPYIVIIVDEVNDLMMMMKREVEGHIIRLAQKSRAAGIHLILATQKPTVDVITGLIKSNLPARICFQVASRSDSRVVLDASGADKLLGKGDMLFLVPGTSHLIRAQGTYADDEEITRIVEYLEGDPCYEDELINLKSKDEEDDTGDLREKLRRQDDMYEPAVEIVIREGRGSVSLLQRALGIGYGRAARLIDFMEEDGIVGGYNGSSARDVMYTPDQWAEMKERMESPLAG